jgi:hypothetical protein
MPERAGMKRSDDAALALRCQRGSTDEDMSAEEPFRSVSRSEISEAEETELEKVCIIDMMWVVGMRECEYDDADLEDLRRLRRHEDGQSVKYERVCGGTARKCNGRVR